MSEDEKYAKLLALSIIYEKDEGCRMPFVERLSCRPKDIGIIMQDVIDPEFREWIISILPVIVRSKAGAKWVSRHSKIK